MARRGRHHHRPVNALVAVKKEPSPTLPNARARPGGGWAPALPWPRPWQHIVAQHRDCGQVTGEGKARGGWTEAASAAMRSTAEKAEWQSAANQGCHSPCTSFRRWKDHDDSGDGADDDGGPAG